MKILIAEDEAVSRKILQRTLQKWGYEVVAAKNGKEALEAFEKDTFQMIITDWMMPEMNGLELVEKIRRSPENDFVYIIMLTAKAQKGDLVVGMEAGADDFVAKPFDRGELQVRLRAGERIIRLEKKLSVRNAELERINQRMRVDLEAAAEIQKSLLPSEIPTIEGVDVAWEYRPCDELAGDILNVFKLDERHLGFYVLDVSGHGVPAALLAVTVSRMLSPTTTDQASLLKTRDKTTGKFSLTPPAEVANQLNRRFQMTPENGQFFTMLYGIIDVKTRRLHYATAGHPPIIRISRHSDQAEMKVASLPIGFLEDVSYEEQFVQLHPGDRLYLYSDGIPEAENRAQDLYGTERMVASLKGNAELSLRESMQMLLVDVHLWAQIALKDDATLMGIEIL